VFCSQPRVSKPGGAQSVFQASSKTISRSYYVWQVGDEQGLPSELHVLTKQLDHFLACAELNQLVYNLLVLTEKYGVAKWLVILNLR
jgi:hypothetical protein